MQKNNGLVYQLGRLIEPINCDVSDEKVEELEWFLKLEAVKAVNAENKSEFEMILDNNDLSGFAVFIQKYVPDFKEKLIEYSIRN